MNDRQVGYNSSNLKNDILLRIEPSNESIQQKASWWQTAKQVAKATSLLVLGLGGYALWKCGTSFINGRLFQKENSSAVQLSNVSSLALVAPPLQRSTLDKRDDHAHVTTERHRMSGELAMRYHKREMVALNTDSTVGAASTQIITSGPKIQMLGLDGYTAFMDIYPGEIGSFMCESIPSTLVTSCNLMALNFVSALRVLSLSVNGLNSALQLLRFSLDDDKSNFNQSIVIIYLGLNPAAPAISASGNISQFGTNQAPVLQANCSLPNITLFLNQQFCVTYSALLQCFVDPDGDAMTFTFSSNNGAEIPLVNYILQQAFSSIAGCEITSISVPRLSGNANSVGIFPVNVSATDGYKKSHQNATLQITVLPSPLITNGPKIQVLANWTNVTLTITLPQTNIGQFMLTAPGLNKVASNFNQGTGVLTLVGTLANINAALRVLRFSLNDDQTSFSQSQVLLAASENGQANWILGTGNLTQFGSNRAPILNGTNPYPNRIIFAGAPFSINLEVSPASFIDPDGDLVSYNVVQYGYTTLPAWIQLVNNTLSGVFNVPNHIDIVVTATDGYKTSRENILFSITFIPPTPAPTPVPTPPPTPEPTDPFENHTYAPQPGLQLITTSSKIQVAANGPSVTLEIKLPQANIGQFMLTASGLDQVISRFNDQLGILTMIGTPANMNAVLNILRFSLNDDQSNFTQGQVLIALSEDGNNWVLSSGNLTQFGTNRAPILNGTYSNQTKNLGESFSVNLAGSPFRFFDPDGDSITYAVTLADGKAIPPWIQYVNSILGGSSSAPVALTITVSATDGYKTSHNSAPFSLTYQYFPPSIINSIPSQLFKVGQGFQYILPSNTFRGDALTYTALANGFPLPSELLFNPNTLMFSGLFTSDWTGNITVIATDLFQNSANLTFKMTVLDTQPVLANPIPIQLVRAKKTIVIPIPSNTFTNNSPNPLTYSVPFLADGTPLPNWIVFDPSTNQMTAIPPIEMLGKTIQIKLIANDGYKSSNTTVTLSILPNQPPHIGTILTNSVAVSGQDFNYLIPAGCFMSPINNSLLLSIQLASNNNETMLPGWISFNDVANLIYGTPTDSDVGEVPITVMADDGLGGKASQTITVSVKLSTLTQILNWIGTGAAIGSGVLTAWGLYIQRYRLLNMVHGKKLVIEKPFSNGLDYKIEHENVAYVTAFREAERDEKGYITRFFACVVAPFSDYLSDQFTLAKLPEGVLPAWLEYDSENKTISVVVDAIKETSSIVTVIITTLEDRILAKFRVNPADFKSLPITLTMLGEGDDLEAPLLPHSTPTESVAHETEELHLTTLEESGASSLIRDEPVSTVGHRKEGRRLSRNSMIGQIGKAKQYNSSLLASDTQPQNEEEEQERNDLESKIGSDHSDHCEEAIL